MIDWRKHQRWIAAAIVLTVLGLPGCGGPPGPKRLAVTGTVTREGIEVDAGNIMFIPKGGGVAAAAIIKDGTYKFTTQDGLPPGSYKVQITQDPLRDPDFKGKKVEAPLLEDTRFEKKMPEKGWEFEAEVDENQTDPIDFQID